LITQRQQSAGVESRSIFFNRAQFLWSATTHQVWRLWRTATCASRRWPPRGRKHLHR
jgi:hypothetical protein